MQQSYVLIFIFAAFWQLNAGLVTESKNVIRPDFYEPVDTADGPIDKKLLFREIVRLSSKPF